MTPGQRRGVSGGREGQHWTLTTTSNGRFDQRVQLFVTSDGELQVTRSDTFHFQILAGISGQLEHLDHRMRGGWGDKGTYLGGQIFEDSGTVHGGSGANSTMRSGSVLQVSMDSTHRELSMGRIGLTGQTKADGTYLETSPG